MNKGQTEYTNWQELNWRKLEKFCWKLQKRIFRAKKEGNVKLVKQLQKLLVKSFAAKAIAVRKVTQDNKGKKTAGIDGVKAITPAKRLELVKSLEISHKAMPLRRIHIPKPGSNEKRPLSIPTIKDGLLKRWTKRRHPNKSRTWVNKKYYHSEKSQLGSRNWVFKEGDQKLIKHADTPIVRHIKVKGDKSPFDGDTNYWATRLGRSLELSKSEAKLLKTQKGKCNYCGRTFKEDDEWEIDHIIPKSLGGKNSDDNLQLLHVHCHDQKTRNDGSLKKGIHDKNQVREERCEVKVSRTVLKTSQRGDSLA